MKMVTACVRTTSLEQVVQALEAKGIRGMTRSEIKGIGEEVGLRQPYAIHDRIELIIPDDRVDEVVQAIVEHSRTGLAGDGVAAVHSLDYAVKIRARERME